MFPPLTQRPIFNREILTWNQSRSFLLDFFHDHRLSLCLNKDDIRFDIPLHSYQFRRRDGCILIIQLGLLSRTLKIHASDIRLSLLGGTRRSSSWGRLVTRAASSALGGTGVVRLTLELCYLLFNRTGSTVCLDKLLYRYGFILGWV